MIDIITYALLKKSAATGIQNAKIEEGGELIFELQDGSTISCGSVFGDSSPIVSVQETPTSLSFLRLDGSSFEVGRAASDLLTAKLEPEGLVLYFVDGTKLVAPQQTITEVSFEGEELVFRFANGTTLNAGKLPISSLIDDTQTSSSKTYSSRFINNILSYDLVLGGSAEQSEAFFGDTLNGGDAGYAPDQEILADASTTKW